jgi:hypothetical protein
MSLQQLEVSNQFEHIFNQNEQGDWVGHLEKPWILIVPPFIFIKWL